MANEKEYKLSFSAEQINVNLGNAEKAILFTEQTLTDEQKAQARANIGCGDSSGGSGLMHIILETELTTGDIVELSESDQEKLNAASALKMPCIISCSADGGTITGVFVYVLVGSMATFSSSFGPSAFINIAKSGDNAAWEGQLAVITQE